MIYDINWIYACLFICAVKNTSNIWIDILMHKYSLRRLPKILLLLVRSSRHQGGGFFYVEANTWRGFVSWDWESKWNQNVKNFIGCGAFDVPNPEYGLTGPLLLVGDEEMLEADVCDAWEAPEENPGHRLLQSEDISSVTPDAAHPSQWAVTAHEPAFLESFEIRQSFK